MVLCVVRDVLEAVVQGVLILEVAALGRVLVRGALAVEHGAVADVDVQYLYSAPGPGASHLVDVVQEVLVLRHPWRPREGTV